ncbi:MAG: hypothetical protein OEM41_04720 [Ignavibacteria bacterium]|nr:hypothetical protein [Ignavibacteria bacterium]
MMEECVIALSTVISTTTFSSWQQIHQQSSYKYKLPQPIRFPFHIISARPAWQLNNLIFCLDLRIRTADLTR